MRIYDAPSELAGKWIREADHLAALRRAKAEVWREAAKDMRKRALNCASVLDSARTMMASEYQDWVSKHELLMALMSDFDARAAQIEEGGNEI